MLMVLEFFYPMDSIALSCQCLSATAVARTLCQTFLVSLFFFEFLLLRRGMFVCASSSFAIVFCGTLLPIFLLRGKEQALGILSFQCL